MAACVGHEHYPNIGLRVEAETQPLDLQPRQIKMLRVPGRPICENIQIVLDNYPIPF
jgi:hypothetical protein